MVTIAPTKSSFRLAFAYPHQYGGTPTIPMAAYPVSMTAEPGYYSKFSNASHRMKKHIERRCSWRCTALIFLILCVAMLACVAYFAGKSIYYIIFHNYDVLCLKNQIFLISQ